MSKKVQTTHMEDDRKLFPLLVDYGKIKARQLGKSIVKHKLSYFSSLLTACCLSCFTWFPSVCP